MKNLFGQDNSKKVSSIVGYVDKQCRHSCFKNSNNGKRKSGRFIILGSASSDLIRDSSESLAGRIAYLERDLPLLGLKADPKLIRKLWQMLKMHGSWIINKSYPKLALI
jgi:hypothetical protein